MRALGFAALGTLFTFAMTALGAATVFFLRREASGCAQKPMLGFAGGVMTAASVWSLLLPAVEQASHWQMPAWVPAAAGLAAGAAFLSALDALLDTMQSLDAARRQNTLLFSAITLHNVPEGMAVGLAFALAVDGEGFALALALALGIGVQNFPEGAAIALPLYKNGENAAHAFVWGALSGAVEPLSGILVVLAASQCRVLMPWLLSFAAGAMLYVVVVELVPRSDGRGGACGYMAGFLLMMVLDVALG